jgi:hypothetical protein
MKRALMRYSGVRNILAMVSSFREPAFRLGVLASDVMETFYKTIQRSQTLNLNDLLTYGGNSYGDLRLTINTFRGGGRIEITPGALIVELRDILPAYPEEVAKEHLQLCEDTLRKALAGVEISQRIMRASLWVACEGGPAAVEHFLGEKGNAALKLDQGAYAALKKEFTLQFNGLDASKGASLGLVLQRSTGEGDLFVQFNHVLHGSPSVTQTVKEQSEVAQQELQTLMLHVGLEPKRDDAGRP